MYSLLIALSLLASQTQPDHEAGPSRAGRPGDAAAAPSLDGTWTVVSMEKNGQAVNRANTMTVTIRANTVSFAGGDGQQKSLRLEFGPLNTLRVTEVDDGRRAAPRRDAGDAKKATDEITGKERAGTEDKAPRAVGERPGPMTGVYVLSNDYFALALNEPGRTGAGTARQPGTEDDRGAAARNQSPTNSTFVIILHKGEAGRGTNRDRSSP